MIVEWFCARGPLAMAVVNETKAASVSVFAGGLEEDPKLALSADATSGSVVFCEGPFAETRTFLGGLTVIDVADGWPQEVRRFKPQPST